MVGAIESFDVDTHDLVTARPHNWHVYAEMEAKPGNILNRAVMRTHILALADFKLRAGQGAGKVFGGQGVHDCGVAEKLQQCCSKKVHASIAWPALM